MTRSRTAQRALDQYRRATRRSDESREHALRELKRRIATGECPAAALQAPAAPQPRPWYVRVQLPLTAAAVAGLGALAVTIIALPHRADDRARPLASKSLPKSAGAPISGQHELARAMPPSAAEPAMPLPAATTPAVDPPAKAARRHDRGLRARGAEVSAPAPAAQSGETAVARTPPPEAASSDLDQELQLIRLAHDALQAGQPERALAHLAEHAARFPRGTLAQARQVTRILALCQAGKSSAAHAEAQRFLALAPTSPYAARVRAGCAQPGSSAERRP